MSLSPGFLSVPWDMTGITYLGPSQTLFSQLHLPRSSVKHKFECHFHSMTLSPVTPFRASLIFPSQLLWKIPGQLFPYKTPRLHHHPASSVAAETVLFNSPLCPQHSAHCMVYVWHSRNTFERMNKEEHPSHQLPNCFSAWLWSSLQPRLVH